MFSTQQYFGFDPRTLTNCTLWLDAADASTITGTTNVTQWNDKSGTGNNATSSTGPSTNTYNGYRVLTFNGTTNFMSSAHTVPRASHTLIAVHRPALINGNNQGNTSLFRYQNGNYIVFPYMNATTPRGYITNADGTGVGSIDFQNSTLVENSVITSLNIITAVIQTGSQQIFKNGTLQSSDTEALSSGTSESLTIGRWNGNGGSEYYQGDVAEMIVFTSPLTTSQRQQVEGYLAWKWGLQANLPTGHPFKSDPIFQRIPTPLDFGPMLFWWDAAEYSSFTPANPTTGTSITGWKDKINGVTLSNVNSSPTWSSNGVVFTNSSATISASTQNLAYSNTSSPYTTTQNFTIVVAHAPNLFTNYRQAFFMIAPLAFNVNPSFFGGVANGASEGNSIGAFNGAGTWLQLQQAAYVLTTANAPRIDTILSAPSNTAWTNGTENTYSIENIGRGTTVAGTATITAMCMSATSTIQGNRAYDGTIYEVLVYSSNLSSNAIRQVEGYLGWKWKAYRNLVNTHPFYNIPTSSPLFTPTAISNCALWLDALDNSRITTSGASVTSVLDKAQNITLTTQGTSSFLTVATNTINGRQSLYFNNGSANNVHLSGTLNNITAGTMVLVFQAAAQLSDFYRPFFTWTSTGGLNFPAFGYTNAGPNVISPYTTFVGPGTPTNTVTVGSNYLAFYSWTGTTTNVGINGTTPTAGSQSGYGSTNSTVRICWDNGPTTTTYLGEIILFSRVINTSERQQLEGYLAWKWGLQPSIPTTHPYYKFRP
jgi:hypothetical protein